MGAYLEDADAASVSRRAAPVSGYGDLIKIVDPRGQAGVPPDIHDPVPQFGDRRRMRVGLLGGSFNPAHAGPSVMSPILRCARLRLDQVWLLVSPGNPLKPTAGMAPFPHRLASARRSATAPRRRERHRGRVPDALHRRHHAAADAAVSQRALCLDHGGGYPGAASALAAMDRYRAAAGVRRAASTQLFASGACRDGRASATGGASSGSGSTLAAGCRAWVGFPARPAECCLGDRHSPGRNPPPSPCPSNTIHPFTKGHVP